MNDNESWLYRIKTWQIIVLIAVIILIIPPVLSIGAKYELFDFSDKGQIGDTLGGITAPFLNGLAALLVFVAFKAQIEANKQITDQTEYNKINDQINRVIDSYNDFSKNVEVFETGNYDSAYLKSISGRIQYMLNEISVGSELILNFTGDKSLLLKRYYFLYTTLYKQDFEKLLNRIDGLDAQLKLYSSTIPSFYLVLRKQIVKVDEVLNNKAFVESIENQ